MAQSKIDFASFARNKYLSSLPILKEERSQKITTIIFTLIAISLFGFFAISPTLTTITTLKKQVDDASFVNEKLKEKIKNLSLLQRQYLDLQNDIPVVLAAVPENPEAPYFSAELQALALRNSIHVSSLQVFQVEVSAKEALRQRSFTFSLQGSGSSQNIASFIKDISSMDRNISIDVLTITNDFVKSTTEVSIKGKAYFQQ